IVSTINLSQNINVAYVYSTIVSSVSVSPSSTIKAVSPAHIAGAVNLTVETTHGASAISSADHFTFYPTVSKVVPNEGPSACGTNVTVTGTGFIAGATTIKFGSANATSVTCTSWKASEPK